MQYKLITIEEFKLLLKDLIDIEVTGKIGYLVNNDGFIDQSFRLVPNDWIILQEKYTTQTIW